jgi:PAS domain S-box-containing protein
VKGGPKGPRTAGSERAYAVGDLALLEAAFASLHEGVTVHDATGRIVACNPSAARLFGLAADEILGASAALRLALDVLYADDTPVTAENSKVTAVLATGEAQQGVLQFRLPHEPVPRWVRGNFHPLLRDGEAEPWGVVCSFADITDPGGAPDRLRDFSRQMRTMLADESAVVYVKDRDGRYLFANRRLGQLLGIPRRRLIGMTDAELVPPEVADECRRSNEAAFAERRVVQAEETFFLDGERRTYLTVKFPLVDDTDQPWAIAGVSIDITERKAVEHDLPDRELLTHHLTQALARARRRNLGVALVVVMIDGGRSGDAERLRALAQRVEATIRQTDVLAILDSRRGAELVVLLSDLPARAAAADLVIDRITQAGDVRVGFGVSVYPDDGLTAEQLLEHAEAAADEAKRGRRMRDAAAIAPVIADLALLTEIASRRGLTVVLDPEPPGWTVGLVGREDRQPFLQVRAATIGEALQQALGAMADPPP